MEGILNKCCVSDGCQRRNGPGRLVALRGTRDCNYRNPHSWLQFQSNGWSHPVLKSVPIAQNSYFFPKGSETASHRYKPFLLLRVINNNRLRKSAKQCPDWWACRNMQPVVLFLTLLLTGNADWNTFKCLNNLWHLKTRWSNSAHIDVVRRFAKPCEARNNKTQGLPMSGLAKEMQAQIITPHHPNTLLFSLSLTHFLNHQTVSSSRIWAVTFISNASWEQILARSVKGSKDFNGYSQAAKLSS